MRCFGSTAVSGTTECKQLVIMPQASTIVLFSAVNENVEFDSFNIVRSCLLVENGPKATSSASVSPK